MFLTIQNTKILLSWVLAPMLIDYNRHIAEANKGHWTFSVCDNSYCGRYRVGQLYSEIVGRGFAWLKFLPESLS